MSKFWKHPQYKHVYGPDINLPICACVYPALVNPKAPPPKEDGSDPGKPKYELSHLLSKGDPNTQLFIQHITPIIVDMIKYYNETAGAPLATDPVRIFKIDGDQSDLEKYPFYKDCWVLPARNVNPVDVTDTGVPPYRNILDREVVVGGCRVISVVQPLITSHGVSFKLKLVQYVDDNNGLRFGGGTRDISEALNVINYNQNIPVPTKTAQVLESAPQTNVVTPVQQELTPSVAAPTPAQNVSTQAAPATNKADVIKQKIAAAQQAKAAEVQTNTAVGGQGKSAAVNLL